MKFAERLEFDGETVTIGGVEPLGYDVVMDIDSIFGLSDSLGMTIIETSQDKYALFCHHTAVVGRIIYALDRFKTHKDWRLLFKSRLNYVPAE